MIAPSLLSADFARLAEDAQRVADADWLHFDVMDAHFVPNLTFGLPVMKAVQAVSPVPLDCHLMIENPERWAPGYAEAGARNVTVHAEACTDPRAVARDIRAAGALAGLALKPGTPLEDYLDVLPDFDTLLVMSVEPGFGGQSFMAEVLPKVRRARRAGRHRAPDPAGRDRRRHQRRHHRAGRRGRRRRVRRGLGGLRRRRPGEGDRRAARAGRRRDARMSVTRRPRCGGAMARARELGAGVLGTTSPNPAVGAVVLAADGTPVGEGATAPPGGPHAEVTALAQAGERARGGTAVVTLEPCAHTGRTGPCADALLAAGVARVVVAVPEPTELAGGGAERLRAAGVDVELGVEQAEAEAGALAGWLTGVREQRPFVIWKVAATLDGRVAAADGTSRWITGDEARAAVHRLRATCDAVVVGSGTALADDPQLTVRDADGRAAPRQPLRVVVDRRRPAPGHRPGARRRRPHARQPGRHAGATCWPSCSTATCAASCSKAARRWPRPSCATGSSTRPWSISHPRSSGAGPSLVGDLGIPTIAGALSLAVADVTRLGGDVEIRLRPNRHTGGQQFADEGS